MSTLTTTDSTSWADVARDNDDSLRGRLRWALVDCTTIVGQEFAHLLRRPSTFAWQLGFPIVTVLLFVYVFGSAMDVAGQGAGAGYLEFAMPGMFAMTMAFGFMNTASPWRSARRRDSSTDSGRCRWPPRLVVTGRGVADLMQAGVDLAILAVIALVLGWRSGGSLAATMAAFLLLLWLRLALIFVGIWLGFRVKNTEAAGNLFALAFPFAMISSVFTPPDLMPGWLGTIAAWNPVSSTATAIRELFVSPTVPSGYWIESHAIAAALIWPAVIAAVFAPLAVREFQRLGR